MSTKILDNGTVLTLGLVGAVAAVGVANQAGIYGPVGSSAKSRGTKKASDPYVFVEGKAPDGSYFGANYKKSQLPGLYQSLRAAGVKRVMLDDTTEVDLTTVQQRGSGAKAPQTDAQVSRAYDEIWDEVIGSGKEWSDDTPNIVYGLLSSRLSSTRTPHQNVSPAEARRVLEQIGDFMDAESEWGPDTLEEVESILRRTRRGAGSAARGGSDRAYREAHNRAVDMANRMGREIGLRRDALGGYSVYAFTEAERHSHRGQVVRPGDPKMQLGSRARGSAARGLRSVDFSFVKATAEESKGMYHPPVVIKAGKDRIVTGAGTNDDLALFRYGSNLLLVVMNERMPYYGATLYTKDDGAWRVDQDVFLQGAEEVEETLGPKWDRLKPATVANRLLAVMS